MATRKSTPKYEVVTSDTKVVIHTGISKTDATRFARDINKRRQTVIVRPLRRALPAA